MHDTRVLVGKVQEENACVISWRGTDNWGMIFRDIEFWGLVPANWDGCKGCSVHSGFYKSWKEISKKVFKALRHVGCGEGMGKSLYLTGHSLGAAVVQVAMFDLADAGYKIEKLYAFEAPRVGNKAWAEAFQEKFKRTKVFRTSHFKDPVVHLPPWMLSYQHIGPEVFIDETGNFTVCENGENITCGDRFENLPGMGLLHAADHCANPLLPNGDMCNPPKCCSRKKGLENVAGLTVTV